MKKTLCLIFAFIILFCGCAQEDVFTTTENGNLISPSGVEYTLLTGEGFLRYLGNLEFQGSVKGEKKTSNHLGDVYQTGLFAIKGDESNNILIRRTPESEWFSIYRNASLAPFDFSVDNCIRLELIPESGYIELDIIHATCNDGIVDASAIAEFLSDVRSQKDPRDAGLYDILKKPDGSLENCYIYAVVYGFFKDEPYLALPMEVVSYNDLAYSISIGNKEYVLPDTWLQKLKNDQ